MLQVLGSDLIKCCDANISERMINVYLYGRCYIHYLIFQLG